MVCAGPCAPCADELRCAQASDCISQVCALDGDLRRCAAPTCNDGVQNGTELGMDCGNQCRSCSCTDDAIVALQAPGRIDGTTVGALSFEDAGCGTSGGAPEVVHRLDVEQQGVTVCQPLAPISYPPVYP